MTLEELIEMDADALSKMSDDELKKHFDQYLDVTRPERQKAKPSNSSAPRIVEYISPAKKAVLDMLKGEGFDYMAHKRKKK